MSEKDRIDRQSSRNTHTSIKQRLLLHTYTTTDNMGVVFFFFFLAKNMGMIKSAISDSLLTSMWVFGLSTNRLLNYLISSHFSIQPPSLAALILKTLLASSFVLLFSFLSPLLGGASFNPATSVAFSTAGLRRTPLLSFAVRFPAQALGGVLGVKGISHVMPLKYRFLLRGPSLKVDLQTGALIEGVLTFLFSFALLMVLTKGPRNMLLKVYMFAWVTVGLFIAGSGYTGPAMNPANAFGWAYVNDKHNSWEQFSVYWIGPLIGSSLAGWVYKFWFPLKKVKQKDA